MNPTIEKFGYPDSLVADYANWVVLLRPAQATLGALVLAHKSKAQAFSDINKESFMELARAVSDIETALRAFRPYQKINYLMLMMVDREVHFHVLPRYDSPQQFGGTTFADSGWPAVPNLGSAPDIEPHTRQALLTALKDCWPA
ncbi:HIT family protein [Limibacillus sp. MBR-115]|jgi:diadenosine tetraphosphate (Ap4A) HIT family hydrolase|uniref:HIT family protein n=1 Tax=Limibacillus sp. MBR-115 TaxID=3156465 RepID=UPI0033937CA9